MLIVCINDLQFRFARFALGLPVLLTTIPLFATLALPYIPRSCGPVWLSRSCPDCLLSGDVAVNEGVWWVVPVDLFEAL